MLVSHYILILLGTVIRRVGECRPNESTPYSSGEPERARLRLKGFLKRLVGYFAAMVVLVPGNLLTTPETPWFMLPMVDWGSILAFHAAYAMGLFGSGAS